MSTNFVINDINKYREFFQSRKWGLRWREKAIIIRLHKKRKDPEAKWMSEKYILKALFRGKKSLFRKRMNFLEERNIISSKKLRGRTYYSIHDNFNPRNKPEEYMEKETSKIRSERNKQYWVGVDEMMQEMRKQRKVSLEAHMVINGDLIKKFGHRGAILFSYLLVKCYVARKKFSAQRISFPCTAQEIKDETGILRGPKDRAIKKFVDGGYMNVTVEGLPATSWFSFNFNNFDPVLKDLAWTIYNIVSEEGEFNEEQKQAV